MLTEINQGKHFLKQFSVTNMIRLNIQNWNFKDESAVAQPPSGLNTYYQQLIINTNEIVETAITI